MPTSDRLDIHPTALIAEGVQLGERVRVGAFTTLRGPLTVGDDVTIGDGCRIGGAPEITTMPQHEPGGYAGVRIASGATIRENVVIHQGSLRSTVIGARSWLLNSSYVAHDVIIGTDCVISSGVKLGGHAEVGSRANIGMNASVHQRRVVSPGAMVGMNTAVSRDVPPFAKVLGSPPRVWGLNIYMLEHLDIDRDIRDALAVAYSRGDTLLQHLPRPTDDQSGAHYVQWWLERETDLRPMRAVERVGLHAE